MSGWFSLARRNTQAVAASPVPAPSELPPLADVEAPVYWGALEPLNGLAEDALSGKKRFLLGPSRTAHVGRTVNSARALCLPYTQVSCFHMSITCIGTAFFVIDDSTNGTYVDGVRAQRGTPTPLTNGAVLSLCSADATCGKVISFRFRALFHTDAAVEQARGAQADWLPDDSEAPATACVVCWAAHVRVLFLPCTHLCVCAACDAGLQRRNCPLCQATVTSSVLVRFP